MIGILKLRPTIKDIAKEAQVSPTAVSIVLKNKDTKRIGSETRDRILEIAKRINYRPNYAARALVHNKSSTLGLIVTTLKNPFYAEISQEIIAYAEERGYSVIASSACGIADELRSANNLLDRGIDGLIICSAHRYDTVVDTLLNQGFPFVLAMRKVERNPGDPPVDQIETDNEGGAFLAVEHLIRLGHKRIAILIGDIQVSTSFDRHLGALAAFESYGLKVANDLMAYGDFERKTALQETLKLMRKPVPPTAIFAYNDYMALGAIDALYELGARVPEDVAVVGFDDIEMAGLPSVSLTTVAQKTANIGRLAVDVLLDKIDGASPPGLKQIVLDPKLIIRRSCGFALGGYKLASKDPVFNAKIHERK